MSKYRVFELAKNFKADYKAVIDLLKKNGFKVANNFSSVDEEGYNVVRDAFAPKKTASPTSEKSAKAVKNVDGAVKAKRTEKPGAKVASVAGGEPKRKVTDEAGNKKDVGKSEKK